MATRDIIWITLESVRRDRTSLASHERETTPFLDRLAAADSAVDMETCVSHAIWTRPSTTSILTGLAPSAHRVWSAESALPDGVTTVPQQLRDRGYRTAAVSPNAQFSAATGLDRGFEQFHYLNKNTLLSEADLRTALGYVRNITSHSAGLTADVRKHCLGYFSDALARKHIREAASAESPLFLYVHLGDTHHPYVPPGSTREQFRDDLRVPVDDAISTALEVSETIHECIASGLPLTETQWNALNVMYDSSLRYVDSLVESIVESARRWLDDPLVVVTADHGECFGERGLLAHMLATHTAVTDVPLVIAGLDDVPSGSGVVQHADAMQLLSNECGLDLDIPLGQDIRETPREFAVTQRGDVRSQTKLEHIHERNPQFPTDRFHDGVLTTLRTAHHQYQRSDSGVELFALPDETTDISGRSASRVDEFDATLDEWRAEHGHPVGSDRRTAAFSEDMEQQLVDLGYL